MATILYQGHGSLRLTTQAGTVVYVDPYMDPTGAKGTSTYGVPASLILVTHQHFDHTAIDLPPHAEGCHVWQNFDAHPDPDTYRTLEYLDVRVEATQAYNSCHPVDECVGYLVSVDGLVVYFSGDTSLTRQMQGDLCHRHIDYAFWPGDGVYNMDVPEAARCANLVGALHNTPVHLKPVVPYDEGRAREFARLAPNALLMQPGQQVTLGGVERGIPSSGTIELPNTFAGGGHGWRPNRPSRHGGARLHRGPGRGARRLRLIN